MSKGKKNFVYGFIYCSNCHNGHRSHYNNGRQRTGNSLGTLPPVIAIVLALITKEVYSSLFFGDTCRRASIFGLRF